MRQRGRHRERLRQRGRQKGRLRQRGRPRLIYQDEKGETEAERLR